jgi:imidazolonepropionase-like amidohydrolase
MKILELLTGVLLFLLATLGTAWAQPIAIVNANVVPMDSERILPGYTVLVDEGHIVEMGQSDDVTLPDGAIVIDAEGGFLMPGLNDMHTHLELRDDDPRSLLLYLATGTTTVRSASGGQLNLDWRDAVDQGELSGPTILTAGRVFFGLVSNNSGQNQIVQAFRIVTLVGPLLLGALVLVFWAVFLKMRGRTNAGLLKKPMVLAFGGALAVIGALLFVTKTPYGSSILPYVVDGPYFISESPQQSVIEVQRQHDEGFDFIKPYDSLTIPEYLAAIEEGNRLGMYVMGHALDEASLETILTSGIDEIAHLDELNFYHWQGEFLSDDFSLNYEAIPTTAELMAANDVNIVSNLSLDEVLIDMIFEPETTLARPEYRMVRPEMLENWRLHGRQTGPFAIQGDYRRDMEFDFFLVLIKALNDAGVNLTTGTDTSNFTEASVPSQIHREIELLVEAGLTNFQALSAATRNAGIILERMGAGSDFGTIELGNRADFILLRENPLDDVSATRERLGVMSHGVWYTQSQIDAQVDAFIASY